MTKNESIGEQFSLVKVVHKTPDNDSYSTFALIQNKYLSALGAALVPTEAGVVSISPTDRNAMLVYTNVEPMQTPNLYHIPEEGDQTGVSSVDFLDNVSRVSVIMTNVVPDPHGYIEKAK